MRVLSVNSDAFGGHGGIALYNRCVLHAVCGHPRRPEVVAIPRVAPLPLEPLPANLDYRDDTIGSKLGFVAAALGRVPGGADLVICGHVNLLPVASAMALATGAPLMLFVYGMEAWRPHASLAVRRLLPRVDAIVGIRKYTLDRLRSWAGIEAVPTHMLENPVSLARFGVRPRNPLLVERYGLAGRRVVMTLARVEHEHFGFDEIIEALPELVAAMPDLVYVVAGRGGHVERLQAKARALGVGEHVRFTGFVADEEKADHYRLADVFAMPGSDPSYFDRYVLRFVFLEAMACGVPVVASAPEGEDEIPQGLPFVAVNPSDRAAVAAGIRRALALPHGVVPDALRAYDIERFAEHLQAIVDGVLARAEDPAPGRWYHRLFQRRGGAATQPVGRS